MRRLVVAAGLVAAVAVQAQPVAEAQNPAPVNTFELEGARLADFSPGGSSESWYRFTYKGALVRGEGTPFKAAAPADPAASAPSTAGVGAGDRHRWTLRYENGSARLGGALLEMAGVQPLDLRGLEALDLRGTAALASDEEGRHIEFAAGLETAPWRLPGFGGTEWTNWIVFGLQGERRHAAADGAQPADTRNTLVVTTRAFLGKGFGWRKSADVGRTASKLERDLLAAAPTAEDAKALAAKIRKSVPPTQRSALQKLLVDAAGDLKADADWRALVREFALGTAEAVTDQPTLTAYAEAIGWADLSGGSGQRRTRGLFSASVDWWPLVSRDDVFLRLRYETGWDWAQPAQRRNRAIVSAVLRF